VLTVTRKTYLVAGGTSLPDHREEQGDGYGDVVVTFTDAVRTELVPTGRLRAAINLGNPVLAQGTPDEPRGVTVAIAAALAAALDAPLDLISVDAARKSHQAMAGGDVDLVFLAIEPAREDTVVFTDAYVLIEGVYVVRPDAPFSHVDDVDRDGVTVGVREGSAYDLFLTRTLQSATLVRADEPTQVFEERRAEVVAGVRQPMTAYVTRTGMRMIEPAFMQIRQAAGLPRSCSDEAVAAVTQFVEELKSSGFVADELRRSGQNATVAPPSSR